MDIFNKKKLSELNELFKKAQKINDDLLESNSNLINLCEKLFKENKALRKFIKSNKLNKEGEK